MASNPPNRDHANFFAGQIGHLTSSQEETFESFKANLSKAELYTASIDSTLASHDDPTLLYVLSLRTVLELLNIFRRFLRARGFALDSAQKQFSNAEKWRKEHNVVTLYNTFDPVEFEAAKRFYPRWTGRRDKVCN